MSAKRKKTHRKKRKKAVKKLYEVQKKTEDKVAEIKTAIDKIGTSAA